MNIDYLFAANAVVWLAVGGYLVFLTAKQKGVSDRLRHMESMHDDE